MHNNNKFRVFRKQNNLVININQTITNNSDLLFCCSLLKICFVDSKEDFMSINGFIRLKFICDDPILSINKVISFEKPEIDFSKLLYSLEFLEKLDTESTSGIIDIIF